MQHGGVWPASSDARTTSLGTTAIERFARPVSLQDIPAALLPPNCVTTTRGYQVHELAAALTRVSPQQLAVA